jgi:SAM-dependent methyltransferase
MESFSATHAGPSPVGAVPVLRGALPRPTERAYVEYVNYNDGAAEQAALGRVDSGEPAAAWRSVRDQFGPFSDAVLAYVLNHPSLGSLVRGDVADIAAGSCWLAGKVSPLPRVERVYAQDLSEGFLQRVGVPVFLDQGGDLAKLTLVASDFNHLPLSNASLDAAFMFAALHHSLSPIPTLREVLRCLRPGGVLFIYEAPLPILGVEKTRRWSETVTDASEIPLTFNDIKFYLAMAGAGAVTWHTLDFSRGPWRRLVRRLLRMARLENWVRPPQYLFIATAKGAADSQGMGPPKQSTG